MITVILVDFLPIIAAIIYAIVYFNGKKKIYKNLNEEQNETLKNIKKKTRVVRTLIVILFIILYGVLTFLDIRNSCINLLNLDTQLTSANQYIDINSIWSIIFGVQKYILIMFVLATLLIDLYVRYTKKLDEKEREIAQNYYCGKTIIGIIVGLVMILYVFAMKFVLSM